MGTKKKVQVKEEYKKQKFIKSGKPYYRVPDECVLGKEKNRCAFCKGELITKKVPVMLYNKEHEMTSILSVELPFCEQCYVPFCSRDKYNLLRGKGLYVETFGYIKHSGQRLWTLMTEPQTKLASRFVLRKDYYEEFGLNDSISNKMNLEKPKNFWVEDKKIYLIDSYLHECVDERVGTPSRYQCVLMNYKSEYEKVDALYCPRCKKLLLKNNLYKNVKEHFPKYNFVDNTKIIEKNIVKAQEEHIITANMLMVCTDVKSCVKKGHQLKDIIALVDVVTPDIEIVKIRIPAGYCKQCNRYFLLEDEYASLSEKGIILCNVIQNNKAEQIDNHARNNFRWNVESTLHKLGYNVDASINLSQEKRQKILMVIVDKGIMSRMEICTHIDLLIRLNKSKPDMKTACEKWSKDRAFIIGYKNNEQLRVVQTEDK